MLRIAIQSKGRLNEESMDLLRQIGIEVDDSKRKFLSKATNFPIELLFIRDDDIAPLVSSGTAALGIVGLNEVEEKGADVDIAARLGFGKCRISLAIPKGNEYSDVHYFDGKSIATSYPGILSHYLEQNGVSSKIEVITGSVEIAPAAGIADAIFDIVSSGGTLVSNGLKEVEKVFFSEAVLIANKNLSKEDKEILDELLFRINSAMISRNKKYILMNIREEDLEKAVSIVPAMRSPTIMPLEAKGWYSLHSVVDAKDLWSKVRQLKEIGAEDILVLNVDKIVM